MRITVLAENTSRLGLPAEHGLSLFIETEKHNILFDTGQSALFAENALKLGVDLKSADIAVISHGHYDHGGGLAAFLSINGSAPVYIHRRAFEPHYNGTEKYIGLDASLAENKRLVFTEGTTEIADGLTLYDCNESQKRVEPGFSGLNMIQNGQMLPDDFRHEHYLMIEENGKRVLISGCSHKGILNIADWFRPDVLVGGFHLSKLPLDSSLTEYARRLSLYPTEYYTCHCTGTEHFELMKQTMKNLHYISTGDIVEIN